MRKKTKRRKQIRPLALLLALTLVFSGIEFSTSTEEVEAASSSACTVCGDGYGVHEIPSSTTIAAWAEANKDMLKNEWVDSNGVRHAHVIEYKGVKYLAWYEPGITKSTGTYYHTTGYYFRSSTYTLGGTTFVNGDAEGHSIWEGSGFTQVEIFNNGAGKSRADLFYVEYDKAIEICQNMKLTLSTKNGISGYSVFLDGYITVYQNYSAYNNGTEFVKNCSVWSTVESAMTKLGFGSSVSDAKQRYNISFFIPAVTVPVVIRYWDVTDPDKPTIMYRSGDKAEMIYDTGISVVVCATLGTKEIYTVDVDFNEALKTLTNNQTSATKGIYDEDGTKIDDGMFVGCQAVVGTTTTTKFVENLNSAVGFKVETLTKEDSLSTDTKYTVARDHRDKDTTLKGSDVTAERLMSSILNSCIFDEVERTDSAKIKTTDACYLDLEYMQMNPTGYEYTVTRSTADYDPETGEYSNTQGQSALIDISKVKDSLLTDDGKFTKTIGTTNFPNYTTSSSTTALGNMIVDGHIYVLAQARLSVTPESGTSTTWSNASTKASWLDNEGISFSSVGGDYAYNTSALTKVLKSYRYYTDSKKLSKYGDSATMKINLLYVCRPPLVRLNYQYDATTKRYTLISTSPASLDSSDDLEYAFANSSISKEVETQQNGEVLQQVYVKKLAYNCKNPRSTYPTYSASRFERKNSSVTSTRV